MADSSARGEMPFLDHLEELRWRLLYALGAVVLGTVAGWFVVQHVDILEILKRPIAPYLPNGRLVFTSPAEPLLLTLKIAFAVGLVLASPVVIYQLWAFLAPALYARERRVIVPALMVGVVLFALGALAAYAYALPATLRVLFDFQRADLAPMITIDRYFGIAIPFILAFGALTELPLVITILAALGVVTPQFLSRHRRWAVMIGAVAAALLSPPDAASMIMMLVPILLLYEVSIWCAWVVHRRRARRQAAAGAAPLVVLVLAFAAAAIPLQAQQPVVRPPVRDTSARAPRPGQPVDTAAARRLGLPTGPTRTFPRADAVLDSLLQLSGYQITRYVADTLVVQGDSQTIHLRGKSFVERGLTQLEADSIRFHEASCRLDAGGDPHLFDQGTVMVGHAMRYDTCLNRGVVADAFTDFDQGGVKWYMRGDMAIDSSSTRMYGSSSEVTSCDLPEPSYHFASRQVKWLNKNLMVVRPAVLYVRDVPILWLPFFFNDIRPGRRSGLLKPEFGLNDLVRTSRSYKRHVTNIGYYFAFSDYLDMTASADWYDDRYMSAELSTNYRWLNRFLAGGVSYRYWSEIGAAFHSHHVGWNHQQRFDSRTSLSANVNYASSTRAIQHATIDPTATVAKLESSVSFSRGFSWGQLSVGGTRSQDLSTDQVNQSFPTVSLAPAPINLTPAITWSPSFAFTNQQALHNGPRLLPVPGGAAPDTVRLFFDNRNTSLSIGTPLRIGRWNWFNAVVVRDEASSDPLELVDSTGQRTLYARTFETGIDWSTGINLPGFFSGSWKLQPSIAIVNTTGAGPFMLRNQHSGGRFVTQGKRLQFSASLSPTFFGFFPGIGPFSRFRHSVSPGITYSYAPGAQVPKPYANVLDPTGRTSNARSDPVQTITFGLNQNIEAKLKPAPGDTTSVRRPIRLLSISTSAVAYNFEVAKQPGRTGWQTGALTNTVTSEVIQGLGFTLIHDLWDGDVGTDSARFAPVLTSVSTGFTVTSATLRGLAALLGLAARPTAAAAPTPVARDTTRQIPGAPDFTQDPRRRTGIGGVSSQGGGRGFSMQVTYSSRTARTDTVLAPGNRVVNLGMSFQPTPKWSANWSTFYDFATQRFGQHVLQLNRDMRRWQATFGFVKSPNGNFAFNFSIALRDEPDIKFDYDQQTFVP